MSAKDLKKITACDFRRNLSSFLENVFFKGDTVAITRYSDRIMAVIISPEEYDRLCGFSIARAVEKRAKK